MILRIFILLVFFEFEAIECYNRTIMFDDVANCAELHLEQEKHYYTDIVTPIEKLCYNQPNQDEILRTKAFFLGSDFYIEMMTNSQKPVYYDPQIRFYHTVLGGWGGTKSKISISGLDGPGLTCGTTDTIGLLDRFYFTELQIVVKKSKNLKLICNNLNQLFPQVVLFSTLNTETLSFNVNWNL